MTQGIRGDLAGIGESEGCVWCQVKVQTGLNDGAVLGNGCAGDGEGVVSRKCMRAFWRGVAKGVPPAERGEGHVRIAAAAACEGAVFPPVSVNPPLRRMT